MQRIKALKAGDYALGWIATDIDGRAVIAHDGEYRGFCSLLVIDAQGRSASFAFTNTEADDKAWTFMLLNRAVLNGETYLAGTNGSAMPELAVALVKINHDHD